MASFFGTQLSSLSVDESGEISLAYTDCCEPKELTAQIPSTIANLPKVSTFASGDLQDLTPNDGDIVAVLGWNAVDDGGGGFVRYSATSTTAVDNGLTFDGAGGTAPVPGASTSTGTGRWIRVLEGNAGLDVKWFGARGNGMADDTDAIQAAYAEIDATTGGYVIFPVGTYLVTGGIDIYQKDNWVIDFGGATLKVADGTGTSGTWILRVRDCENWRILGGTFDGNRAGRTPAESTSHLLYVQDGVNGVVDSLVAKNGTCDGIYIGPEDNTDAATFPTNMEFRNVTADNNYRQGMSIINGIDINVIGGYYVNTTGTAPQYGIDIEANSGTATPSNRGVNILGCYIGGNAGYGVGIVSEGEPVGINISKCLIEDCDGGGVYVGGVVAIEGNTFRNFTSATAGIVNIVTSANTHDTRVVGNHFADVTAAVPCVMVDDGPTIVANNTAEAVYSFCNLSDNYCQCSNNVIRTPAVSVGVISVGAAWCSVTNNTIYDANHCAIYIDTSTALTRFTFTADDSTDVITAVGHTFTNGTRIELTNSGGTLPAGLALKTVYYVRDLSGDTFKIELFPGSGAVNITDTGSGTHRCTVLAETIVGGNAIIDSDVSASATYGSVRCLSGAVQCFNNTILKTTPDATAYAIRVDDVGCTISNNIIVGYHTSTPVYFASAGYAPNYHFGHMMFGNHHLWPDSTGDFRIKSGTPTSDTDGTIVGTQS